MSDPSPAPAEMRHDPEELRIGLVLNGGVSLAVWIGGVTHEIDRLRRAGTAVAREARPAPDGSLLGSASRPPVADVDVADARAYAEGLHRAGLRRGARVDVIAGASAGGINGAVLAAAVQGTTVDGAGDEPRTRVRRFATPDGGSLRDLWLELGDIEKLTRSPREPDPPSVLRGDGYMVPALAAVTGNLLVGDDETAIDHALYLYVTATDLRGERDAVFDTDSGGPIVERDHRVVFRFSARTRQELEEEPALGSDLDDLDRRDARDGHDVGQTLRDTMALERDNAVRLARAARASSSFPGAFPPHRVVMRRDGEGWDDEGERRVALHLADGGILDNQPMRPVLDRVALMPVSVPWKRVILYVVPYVSERTAGRETPPPSLRETVFSGGLARDLPKLESLQRIEEARALGRAPHRIPHPSDDEALDAVISAAPALYPLYLQGLRQALDARADRWAASPPGAATGRDGAPEYTGDERCARPVPAGAPSAPVALPPDDWASALALDDATVRRWPPDVLERFSYTALEWLLRAPPPEDHVDEAVLEDARRAASQLTIDARALMSAHRREMTGRLRAAMRDGAGGRPTPEQGRRAFAEARQALLHGTEEAAAARSLRATVANLARVFPPGEDGIMAALVAVDVTGRAVTDPAPRAPAFDFHRVTAIGGVLGNLRCTTPETKLAGMQLGHFAAFLKRSWRANDWMWGRLDGVAVLGRILRDIDVARTADDAAADERWDRWIRERQIEILREELPVLAVAIADDEAAGFSASGAASRWRRRHAGVLDALGQPAAAGPAVTDGDVLDAFRAWHLDHENLVGDETGARATVARITRLAAVASRALSGAASGLPAPVRGALAATRGVTRFTDAVTQGVARWPVFGFALVVLLAALAAVLAASDAIGASLLVPALVAAAVAGAWVGFGFLSNPPTWTRVGVIGGILAALVVAHLAQGVPEDLGDLFGSGWMTVAWLTALVAAAAALVLLVLFALSVRSEALRWDHAARRRRLLLGLALLVLLAVWLVRLGVDAIDDGAACEPGVDGAACADTWWEEFFTSRELLLTVLVLGVAASIVTAVVEVGRALLDSADWRPPGT